MIAARAAVPALDIRGLTVSYGGAAVLRHADVALDPGHVVGVLGPNGAGKSTLLKAVMGLVPVAAGEIRMGEAPIATARRQVAYLPQRAAVDWDFPALVWDVVAMGRSARNGGLGWLRAGDRRAIAAALERVGMDDLRDRPIGDLSGGQQQRVLVARAMVADARVVLLDEPFAGVDAVSEQVLQAQVAALAAQGRTVVVVHHDLSTVGERFDDLLLLAGRVVAFGPTDQVFTGRLLAEAYGAPVGPAGVALGGTR